MKKAVSDSLVNDQPYVIHILSKVLVHYIWDYGWNRESDMDDHVDLRVTYNCSGKKNMFYDIKRATYSNRNKNWSIPSYINYDKCDDNQYFIFIQDADCPTYANVYVIRRNTINKYIIADKSNDIYTVIDKDALIKDIQYGPENFFGDMWMFQADDTSKALLRLLTNKDN